MTLTEKVGSFVILYTLVLLLVLAFSGIKEGYNLEEQNTVNGQNVFERLATINMIKGITAMQEGITKIAAIGESQDIAGGILQSALGSLTVVGGIITFPVDIAGAIFGKGTTAGPYQGLVPAPVSAMVGFLVIVAIFFILIKAKTGVEV